MNNERAGGRMTQAAADHEAVPDFSLLGGPFHRLGCRLGLIRRGTNTVALGLALGILLWSVIVVLAFIEGVDRQLFTFSEVGGHTRLLLVIPLLFLCESWLDPRVAAWVKSLERAGIVPPSALPALRYEVERISRWNNSWLPDTICLLLAVLMSVFATDLQVSGFTATRDPSRAVDQMYLTALWYWFVCLTIFRFLLFRWLWRLGLWSFFLWRVSRLDLDLVPTHPDNAGGLGGLELVHTYFVPLVWAISVVQSANFAEEIYAGAMTFDDIYPGVALVLAAVAVLFLGPLFVFTPKLVVCRAKGLSDYGRLAASYVRNFHRKWLGTSAPPDESLLGTPDIQSLADLANSVSIVRGMRYVPIGGRLLRNMVIAAIMPMVPLLLFKFPLVDLAKKLLSLLTGM